jgi:UPF0271 protein
MAVEKEAVATACAEAVARFNPQLVYVALAGEKGAMMVKAARKAGLRVAREFFADRAYTAQGTLVSRRLEGSLITDTAAAAERVLGVIEDQQVEAFDGTRLPLQAETICLHSFQPGSAKMAAGIRRRLEHSGIRFVPMTELV